MDLPVEDFLSYHKGYGKDHGKNHGGDRTKHHKQGHAKDYDYHEDYGHDTGFDYERVNRKYINIHKVLSKCGKFRRECRHTGPLVPKHDNIPSSIFDLNRMEAVSLDPECGRCVRKLDEYDIVSYV